MNCLRSRSINIVDQYEKFEEEIFTINEHKVIEMVFHAHGMA